MRATTALVIVACLSGAAFPSRAGGGRDHDGNDGHRVLGILHARLREVLAKYGRLESR